MTTKVTGGMLNDAALTDLGGATLAQGDVLYYNGSNLVNLGAGTSGQFLKTQGAGANPVWADAGGGGVLQVRTKALGYYTSSSINGDVLPTGWSETITMADSTNALMITAYSECYHPNSSGNVYVGLKLYEGSTHLTASSSPDSGTIEASALNYFSGQNFRAPTQITWIYKPASASALTFNLYVYGNAGAQGSPSTSWSSTRLTLTELDGSLVNVA